jgi:hypothetical protein
MGTGAAVVGAGGLLTVAHLTHRLDDVADALGVEPKALPDADDTRLVRRTARECTTLLTTVEAAAAASSGAALAPVTAIVRRQLAAVGGSPATTASPTPVTLDELEQALTTSSARRAADAVRAGSPALVRVLASMSAGQAQCARAVGALS